MINDIFIRPVTGTFDVKQLESYILSLPNSVRDPQTDGRIMIAYADYALEKSLRELAATPGQYPLSLILVTVEPGLVLIAYRLSFNEPARQIVEWLRSHYDVKISDEYFRDLTAQCKDNLDVLFEGS